MDLQPHEVLLKLVVPFTRPNEYVKEFKQVRACWHLCLCSKRGRSHDVPNEGWPSQYYPRRSPDLLAPTSSSDASFPSHLPSPRVVCKHEHDSRALLVPGLHLVKTKSGVTYMWPCCCPMQSPRREDDIAIVNAGMRVRLEPAPDAPGTWHVAEAAVAYGGVAARAVMAPAVAAAMVGKAWGQDALQVGGGARVGIGRHGLHSGGHVDGWGHGSE